MENKRYKVMAVVLVSAMVALAAMGCWFCWHCPSRIYPPDAHDLFWRQLAWNGVGLVAFAAAWAVGWRRCLKVAPWLMGFWLLAFAAAKLGRPINGTYRWLCLSGIFPRPFNMLNINVMTCFVPVLALFVSWLHEKGWMRRWMEWFFLALLVAVATCCVFGSESRMMRIVAFLHPSEDAFRYLYMGEQMHSAVSVANWFGDAGRGLYLLPCPESDGMMAASALLFGKWFPAAVCMLFGVVGAAFTLLWRGAADASKRWFLLLFAVWLLVPEVYCHLQSLGLLPVAGFSPALVGAGGTAIVMAWFGMGVVMAFGKTEARPAQGLVGDVVPCLVAAGLTLIAVLAIAWTSEEGRKFYDNVSPKDIGYIPRRGVILAADDSILSAPNWRWSYHLDPKVPADKDTVRSCAEELAAVFEIPEERLLRDFLRTDSRYIPLKDVEADGVEEEWYRTRGRRLKPYGLIREPIQGRCYELGNAALPVVGTVHRTLPREEPRGACGLEYLFDGELKAKDNVPGNLVYTTIVPPFQKKIDAILADACMTNKALAAWGMVLKIQSGEIAAMASVKGGTNGVMHTSYNGSAHCNFEPGDLIKPIACAIALNEGVLKDGAELDQDSVVSKVGAEKFHEYLGKLGFGSKVSGRTVCGEEAGIFADAKRWDEVTCAHIGMGHGIAVTGLQLVQAYATFANHGRLVKPRLVTKVVDMKSRNIVEDFMSETNETIQVLSPFAADAVAKTLVDGMPAAIQMVENGEYSEARFIVACAGVFPHEMPEYVAVVALEDVDQETAAKGAVKSVWEKVASYRACLSSL